MLQIIILLLKIIGILLLCVLGLILLLLLTTLLVPIRYRVAIEHGENLFYLKSRVSWLLHVVHLNISHIEGILHIQARLFGFIVYDNQKPKKPKEKKSSEKKKVVREKAVKKSIGKKTAKNTTTRNQNIKNEQAAQTKHGLTETPEASVEPSVPVIEVKERSANQTIGKDSASSPSSEKERKSVFQKLKERVKDIRIRIATFIREMKEKISRILTTISSYRNKLDLILCFLRDEINKQGMHITFSSLKRLLKHILPTKLRSKLIFGTGDPCSTGQALGVMSILYSFYGDRIRITPDFERSILEGQHFAKGRIRLVTVLIIVVKLIFDKKFKQLKNNFIILKEAL